MTEELCRKIRELLQTDSDVLSSFRFVKIRTEVGRRDISGDYLWGLQVFKALPKQWQMWNGESILGIQENQEVYICLSSTFDSILFLSTNFSFLKLLITNV